MARAVWLAGLLTAGCATNPPSPATPPAPPAHQGISPAAARERGLASVAALRAELDAIFDGAVFDHGMWGVAVQSLETGEMLYRRNASKLMIPASNMKILTTAVAAERLGWDFQFETTLVTFAPIDGGVVRGDVFVVGSGDPTIGRDGDQASAAVFEGWADTLRAAGIQSIDGRLVGDDDAFDEQGLAPDWSWDDVAQAYSAPTGALQFNENVVELVIRPGAASGAAVALDVRPAGSGLTVVNRLVTGPPESRRSVDLRRLAGQTTLIASGSVPAGGRETVTRASVESPTLFFVHALRETLATRGIAVRGSAIDIDDLQQGEPPGRGATAAGAGRGQPPRILVSHRSAPLSEIATRLMKVSQNLYAETFLKALGRTRGVGSIENGREVAQETLEGWGIPPTGYRIGDGSGLSRRDYLSPDTILVLLRRMYRDPKHRDRFLATLPVAGKDGTLSQRMKGTRAEGLLAKTGTLSNVRSLSGYVTTANGELLAFSILANNFLVPTAAVDAAAELAAERLANFSR